MMEDDKKKRYMYGSASIFIFLLIALVMINPFCGLRVPAGLEEKPYRNKMYGFSFKPPEGWKLDSEEKGVIRFIGHEEFSKATCLDVSYFGFEEPNGEEALEKFVESRKNEIESLYVSEKYSEVGQEYVEITREVKKKEVTKKIPVIVFSTRLEKDTYIHYQAYVFEGQDALMLTFNVHKSEYTSAAKELFEAVIDSVKWKKAKKKKR